MLTDEQARELASLIRSNKDGIELFFALREAYRLGMLRAADVCEHMSTRAADAQECAAAIRAEAGE